MTRILFILLLFVAGCSAPKKAAHPQPQDYKVAGHGVFEQVLASPQVVVGNTIEPIATNDNCVTYLNVEKNHQFDVCNKTNILIVWDNPCPSNGIFVLSHSFDMITWTDIGLTTNNQVNQPISYKKEFFRVELQHL